MLKVPSHGCGKPNQALVAISVRLGREQFCVPGEFQQALSLLRQAEAVGGETFKHVFPAGLPGRLSHAIVIVLQTLFIRSLLSTSKSGDILSKRGKYPRSTFLFPFWTLSSLWISDIGKYHPGLSPVCTSEPGRSFWAASAPPEK